MAKCGVIKKVLLVSFVLSLVACGGGGDTGGTNDTAGTDGSGGSGGAGGSGNAGLTSVRDSNWSILNRAPTVNDVVYSGANYIAVGDYGYIAESADGTSWTQVYSDNAVSFTEVAVKANSSTAVAVPDARSSLDGVAVNTGSGWQIVGGFNSTDCKKINHIIHDGSQFVGIFDTNKICTSTDGSSWALRSTYNGMNSQKIAFGAGKYAIISNGALVTIASLDSTATSVPSTPFGTSTVGSIIFANGKFLAVQQSKIIYSSDGGTWLAAAGTTIPANIVSVSSSGSTFIAFGNSKLYTSTDAANWTEVSSSSYPPLRSYFSFAVAGGATTTVIAASSDVFSTSDLNIWSKNPQATQPKGDLNHYFSANNLEFVVARDSTAAQLSSDNKSSWSDVRPGVGKIKSIIHDGSKYLASGRDGIATSADGTSWSQVFSFNVNAVFRASATLGTTNYYFASSGSSGYQVLSSDDGNTFKILGNAMSPGVGGTGAVLDYKQVASNGTSIMVVTTTAGDILQYEKTRNTWQRAANLAPEPTQLLNDVIWTGSNFVVVGSKGLVMTSNDGLTWVTQSSWPNATGIITDILQVTNTLYATDNRGTIAYSTDNGVSWTTAHDYSASLGTEKISIKDLAFDGSKIFGFGRFNGTTSSSAVLVSVLEADGTKPWPTPALESSGPNGHVSYDSNRFVSLSRVNSLESTDGISWASTTNYPTSAEFAFIAVSNKLSQIGLNMLDAITFDSSAGSYQSGFATSADGTNWQLKLDSAPYYGYSPQSGVYAEKIGNDSRDNMYEVGALLVSNDGVSFARPTSVTPSDFIPTQLSFIKYVNGLYIAIESGLNDSAPTKILTSSNATDWTLKTSLTSDVTQWVGQVSDIEYDGTQYLILFNDIKLQQSAPSQPKGTMIIKTPDLVDLTLLETGIREPMNNLILGTNGYTLIGENGVIATHAAYR